MPRNILVAAVLLLSAVLGWLILGIANRWAGTLVFEVHLRKSEFYVGEPVVAKIVWRNESRIRLGVEHWSVMTGPLGYYLGVEAEPDLEVRLVHESEHELAGRARLLDLLFGAQDPLVPGREISRSVRLERGFDLSQPGSYELQVDFEPLYAGAYTHCDYGAGKPGLAGRWLARRFRSVAETHFEIIPWSDESLLDARSQAAAGDPGAVRLLGLHGGDESISLLLECLVSEDREVRYEAADALGRIGTSAAIAGLGEVAVGELDPIIKFQMVEVLMDLDLTEALPWLKLMLHDTVYVNESSYGSGERVRYYFIRSVVLTYLENRGQDVEAVFEEVISDSE